MAQPTTARFGRFRVLLGDDSNPTVYTAPCGFTSKSLTLTKSLTDVNLPDCDDPDAVAWVGRDAESLSAAVSGEGVLAAESVEAWLEAWEAVDSIPVKIEVEFPAKTIVWTGRMHVASFAASTEQGGRVTASIEMSSDGELVRATNAAAAPANALLPSISGVAQQGVVLTASEGVWSNFPTSFAYKWQEDDSGWTDIGGATSKTFTPGAGQVGLSLRVIVTASNGYGAGSPATSGATADVLAA